MPSSKVMGVPASLPERGTTSTSFPQIFSWVGCSMCQKQGSFKGFKNEPNDMLGNGDLK